MRVIVSGGGTGGHIFPAVAIANAIKARHPEADILFVGAKGKMEMEKVPQAGYPIKGLPIDGLHRQFNLHNIMRNITLPFRIVISHCMVNSILKDFNPDVVVGVGGYASEPTLRGAQRLGIPTLLQEQNSYAGLTNKMLARGARTICVAYEGMDRFFDANKIVLTGNPVRRDIEEMTATHLEGAQHFGLNPAYPIVLSVGGSLGASSMNRMLLHHAAELKENHVQLIWQTGRWMFDEVEDAVHKAGLEEWVKVHKFISRMDLAYAAADVIMSRAGALSISELCLVAKPMILVPSPNVAEDHQTKNAQSLVNKGAAIMVSDARCDADAIPNLLKIIGSAEMQRSMSQNCSQLGLRHAADKIVDEIERIVKK